MYYDIHTHKVYKEDNVISIVNHDADDDASCLDFQQGCYSLGLHPWKLREETWPEAIGFLEQNAAGRNIAAIGECGLDKCCGTPWKLQEKAFIEQILISEKRMKPVIVHCVKAWDEIIALKKMMQPRQAWLIHGFRGNPQQMEQLIKHNLLFSFGEKYNEETLKMTPLNRLFLETDDARCSIQSIYEGVATLLKMDLSGLKPQIEENVKLWLQGSLKINLLY